jgi:hypothetical protein
LPKKGGKRSVETTDECWPVITAPGGDEIATIGIFVEGLGKKCILCIPEAALHASAPTPTNASFVVKGEAGGVTKVGFVNIVRKRQGHLD